MRKERKSLKTFSTSHIHTNEQQQRQRDMYHFPPFKFTSNPPQGLNSNPARKNKKAVLSGIFVKFHLLLLTRLATALSDCRSFEHRRKFNLRRQHASTLITSSGSGSSTRDK
jgi:hypothetical protein